MTAQDSQNLNLNKGDRAAQLSQPARLVHRTILTTYAHTGQPPAHADLARIAHAAGVNPDAVLDELTDVDLIVRDPRGDLTAAYPFSTNATPHRLTLADGTGVFAMCAIDALGTSAMLGQPITITSSEPATGHHIVVHVDGEQATWQPATTVVYAAAAGDCCAPSAERTCGYINFFTTDTTAHAWAAHHPHLTGTLLDRTQAIACGTAEFGALLHDHDLPG
ncbi:MULTISPECIES: organomercurial lyase [Micromonospora]|uniref:Alkylmercury lyase n=1 Tax=Micromonospora echinofusca TaxID=47858 RepID=A0A1C5G6U0_MICEH|nr:organomercurial lyase [Micromonospora echinofusca]SCG15625.1 Alkylmercury lyase [Micromonospora echinofusca]